MSECVKYKVPMIMMLSGNTAPILLLTAFHKSVIIHNCNILMYLSLMCDAVLMDYSI
jgi:hypothetical protein